MSSSRLSQEQLHHPLSLIRPAISPPSFPCRHGSFVQIDCRLEGSLTENCAYRETRQWSINVGRRQVTMDMLPDVALLEIFDCYMDQAREGRYPLRIQAWYTLVHVCRKWRTIVLGSPLRLDLRLFCMDTTPVKETLAIWPPLPIVIWTDGPPTQMDNIIVALEHNNRVCQIELYDVTHSQLEEVLLAMQQPFPALMDLAIWLEPWYNVEDGMPPVIPELFLGGSAPRLRDLTLCHIPFPGLPKLLLSATHLINLSLFDIPHSGYISPDTIVRCLSALTGLKTLSLGFESPLSRPNRERRPLPPPTCSVLPSLTFFYFKGVSEYLEDLVARIDAPLLDNLEITFFHQLIFDTPQLVKFISRTPNVQPSVEARIIFDDNVEVASPRTFPRTFELRISCRQSDWQLSSLTQVCSSSIPEPFISTVEQLYIYDWQRHWQDDIEDSQWLEVLHPFTAVKHLYLSQEFASRIAPALHELAGEVLPSLQNIFFKDLHLSGPVQGAIGKFVAARELAGHPIAVSHWDGN